MQNLHQTVTSTEKVWIRIDVPRNPRSFPTFANPEFWTRTDALASMNFGARKTTRTAVLMIRMLRMSVSRTSIHRSKFYERYDRKSYI